MCKQYSFSGALQGRIRLSVVLCSAAQPTSITLRNFCSLCPPQALGSLCAQLSSLEISEAPGPSDVAVSFATGKPEETSRRHESQHVAVVMP